MNAESHPMPFMIMFYAAALFAVWRCLVYTSEVVGAPKTSLSQKILATVMTLSVMLSTFVVWLVDSGRL